MTMPTAFVFIFSPECTLSLSPGRKPHHLVVPEEGPSKDCMGHIVAHTGPLPVYPSFQNAMLEVMVRLCTVTGLNESNCEIVSNILCGTGRAPLDITGTVDPSNPNESSPKCAHAQTSPLDSAGTTQEEMIAKPKGSSGKPSGDYKAAQEFLQDLARESLDLTKSYKSQDPEPIEELCRKAYNKLPILKWYENHWVTKKPLGDVFEIFGAKGQSLQHY
ncbi:hypothetical protein K439DRAFT_1533438 [Ramaria rubella]|nr:hypothetical protein K439DRAFT_1533438 [Ramaria rubella]